MPNLGLLLCPKVVKKYLWIGGREVGGGGGAESKFSVQLRPKLANGFAVLQVVIQKSGPFPAMLITPGDNI